MTSVSHTFSRLYPECLHVFTISWTRDAETTEFFAMLHWEILFWSVEPQPMFACKDRAFGGCSSVTTRSPVPSEPAVMVNDESGSRPALHLTLLYFRSTLEECGVPHAASPTANIWTWPTNSRFDLLFLFIQTLFLYPVTWFFLWGSMKPIKQ